MKNYLLPALAAAALSMTVSLAHADPVPLGCSGDDCGPVSIPNPTNAPTAGDAQPVGTAPGGPIEAPSTPNRDPIAPNEPPSP